MIEVIDSPVINRLINMSCNSYIKSKSRVTFIGNVAVALWADSVVGATVAQVVVPLWPCRCNCHQAKHSDLKVYCTYFFNIKVD